MTKSYDSMTVPELEAENQKLMAQKAEIKQKQRELNDVLNKRAAQAKAESLAASLTDSEREALTQIIRPEGIGVKTELGKIG